METSGPGSFPETVKIIRQAFCLELVPGGMSGTSLLFISCRTNLRSVYYQPLSISVTTVSISEPVTRSVMPFQKVPAPTEDGIRSEPSKRKVLAF